MIDMQRFQEILTRYKKDFVAFTWKGEKYKWEAVKSFQDHWDIGAENFAEMLKQSFANTYNLLASHMNYPASSIVEFAGKYPEEVRAMFIDLFDESKEVYERISNFKSKASEILPRMNWGQAQHYQHENAISIYLWLRYPNKYYIYKYGEVKKCSEELHSDYKFSKGSYASNLRNFYKFYDEIASNLQQDEEVKGILQNALTPLCYPDPELRTLTADFGFYISHYIAGKDEGFTAEEEFDENDPDLMADDWHPTLDKYTPGFTKEKWLELLNRKDIIGPVWGGTLAAFYGMGGTATCTQIGEKYNKSPFSISGYCTNLAKRIHKVTDCPILSRNNGQNNYWPILFQGKKAGPEIRGEFLWKLRPELFEALTEYDIMKLEWKVEPAPQPQENIQYWWLNANPKIWSFSSIAIGEAQSYTLYNENGNKRRIFQNFLDAKAGDLIIGYESNPVKQVVALAKITVAQDGEKLQFEKTEGLNNPIDYLTLKESPELENMEYFQNPQGSLFKLTKAEYDFIFDLVREENPLANEEMTDTYTKDDFLEQVYMSEERYDALKAVLLNKKNVILQGAPGVGKTFAARRLAYSIMGEKDESRIEFVQFHQNYSYEDFVMGYKPSGEGFELKNGVFYRFCQKAANQPKKEYFFIIDEINRGNLSKIFGELLMLIEKDYRGMKATLAYNGLPFTVPDNLYIIGMMNTADRSLAMIDYALRRRFSFFEMEPGFDSEGFIQYQKNLNSETLDRLVECVKELNDEIAKDKSLGKGFCIGHSYFCGRDICTDEWLRSVVEYDILPMLSEYWFDEPDSLKRWGNKLRGVFQ